MKFALNYSPQAEELLRAGTIDVDLLKCSSDFPEHIPISKKLKPVTVHFALNAGRPAQKPFDIPMIERMLAETDTKYVNMHLVSLTTDFPDIDIDSEKPEDKERVIEQMIKDVRIISNHFGPENVILENLPYFSTARLEKKAATEDILRICILPESINRVIEETGCFFLFDIDHARTAAYYLKQDAKEYIGQLPLGRTREFHMTGMAMTDRWLQSHLEMQPEDWDYFDWSLEQIAAKKWGNPGIMAFEYGGVGPAFEWRSKKEVIEKQVPEFVRRIRSVQS